MSYYTAPISLSLFTIPGRSTRMNRISAETQVLKPELAPVSTAFTFTQVEGTSGEVRVLLVTDYRGAHIEAIDLADLGAPVGADVFDASAAVGDEALKRAATTRGSRSRYVIDDLLPSGAMVDKHLATGANFLEHAKEASSRTVFNFPKFGKPTPARTTLVVKPGTLMDYEAEISVRFDRDIRSIADFRAARMGFFLCGDFTDRARLVHMIDSKNIRSARGFSDAKSGADYFPTGPFLVIPHNWRTFIQKERIVTYLNGELRQDARGGEMILDFEALVAKALTNGGGGNYCFRGKPIPLLDDETIARGSAVMSGTGEGVIFMPPTWEDKLGGILDHILLGRFLHEKSPFNSIANRFVRNELKAERYMRVGDKVVHESSSMGAVHVKLIAPDDPRQNIRKPGSSVPSIDDETSLTCMSGEHR
ncbi:hypothetical protein GCM10009096_01870 [Parasphingorhabdus litoris]|uniref:Fumarylacetoacetase-like C-terminal domain-containing protein n=1 Tax=Parasphingorhabdus litoris TaxID=394733 RepID=A0ABN1A115_9SPHN|nr:fumarylacetoacetate hydrolase family protein [Parasphingorhabdus litoris]